MASCWRHGRLYLYIEDDSQVRVRCYAVWVGSRLDCSTLALGCGPLPGHAWAARVMLNDGWRVGN